MKVVIAPDKFKGCLSARAAAEAIAAGVRCAGAGTGGTGGTGGAGEVEVDLCPLADGGEGTVEALVSARGGRIERRMVTGPLVGMRVEAPIGLFEEAGGTTAVIEMASAAGLHLLTDEQRNPMRTTTWGVGELMRAAMELGAGTIILGLGGSATMDGGIGAIQAWGGRIELESGTFYGQRDRKLTGRDLASILSITDPKNPAPVHVHPLKQRKSAPLLPGPPAPRADLSAGVRVVAACDVGNPLLGANGAARVFGPQKGATPEQVEQIEAAMRRLAEGCSAMEAAQTPGAGAAGGLGFSLRAFFNAELRSGAEMIIEATRLEQRLASADLCITGEGRFDSQSLGGKTTVAVARACRRAGVPCLVLAGSVGEGLEAALAEGVTAWRSIAPGPITLEESMARAAELVKDAAENEVRMVGR